MKLISKTSSMVITDTYEIELSAGNSVIVIDYLDDSGKVIDTRFQDAQGNDLSNDLGDYDAVMEFIDQIS
jgi:hypothetical protein